MLVQTKGKLLNLRVGQSITLGEDRRGNAHAIALDNDVVARRPGRVAIDAQLEFEVFVVGELLVAEELGGGIEVDRRGVGRVASFDDLQ